MGSHAAAKLVEKARAAEDARMAAAGPAAEGWGRYAAPPATTFAPAAFAAPPAAQKEQEQNQEQGTVYTQHIYRNVGAAGVGQTSRGKVGSQQAQSQAQSQSHSHAKSQKQVPTYTASVVVPDGAVGGDTIILGSPSGNGSTVTARLPLQSQPGEVRPMNSHCSNAYTQPQRQRQRPRCG